MRLLTMVPTLAMCTLLTTMATAQTVPEVKLPASPMGQAAAQVGGSWQKTAEGERYSGGKWVVVDYSRPTLRGRRNIFGSGDEYGKTVMAGSPVWRAGANATTTLTTQVPLLVGGKTIQPGVYNVFVDLKAGSWTLILSNQERQPKYDPNDKTRLYGSYNYETKFDVVRTPMQVDSVDYSIDQFTITILNVTESSFALAMAWENTVASAQIGIAK
jgi:hypothetical protein